MFLVKTMILFFILKCLSFIVNISFYRLVEYRRHGSRRSGGSWRCSDQWRRRGATVCIKSYALCFDQFIARNTKIYRLMLLSCHWIGQTNVTKPWTDKQKLRFISTSSNVRPIYNVYQSNKLRYSSDNISLHRVVWPTILKIILKNTQR